VLIVAINLFSKNGESKKKNFGVGWGFYFRGDGIEENGLEMMGWGFDQSSLILSFISSSLLYLFS